MCAESIPIGSLSSAQASPEVGEECWCHWASPKGSHIQQNSNPPSGSIPRREPNHSTCREHPKEGAKPHLCAESIPCGSLSSAQARSQVGKDEVVIGHPPQRSHIMVAGIWHSRHADIEGNCFSESDHRLHDWMGASQELGAKPQSTAGWRMKRSAT